jgi:hypothetical protein
LRAFGPAAMLLSNYKFDSKSSRKTLIHMMDLVLWGRYLGMIAMPGNDNFSPKTNHHHHTIVNVIVMLKTGKKLCHYLRQLKI